MNKLNADLTSGEEVEVNNVGGAPVSEFRIKNHPDLDHITVAWIDNDDKDVI